MIRVKTATEQKISGQIGQPAACMIENKAYLSATMRGVESTIKTSRRYVIVHHLDRDG
jgi:hypothetical protein